MGLLTNEYGETSIPRVAVASTLAVALVAGGAVGVARMTAAPAADEGAPVAAEAGAREDAGADASPPAEPRATFSPKDGEQAPVTREDGAGGDAPAAAGDDGPSPGQGATTAAGEAGKARVSLTDAEALAAYVDASDAQQIARQVRASGLSGAESAWAYAEDIRATDGGCTLAVRCDNPNGTSSVYKATWDKAFGLLEITVSE